MGMAYNYNYNYNYNSTKLINTLKTECHRKWRQYQNGLKVLNKYLQFECSLFSSYNYFLLSHLL